MKKILFLLSVFSKSFFAQTSVPAGNISGTWTPAGSPYNVIGDITVASTTTLLIQPGVTVNFQGHYKFNVLGSLVAIGQPANVIKFTAASVSTGWYGLRLLNSVSFLDSTFLNYCWIERGLANGNYYDAFGGGIFIENFSNLVVTSCTITNNSATRGGGIYCDASDITISNNVISSNTGGGIHIASGNDTIIGNQLVNNSGGGISTEPGSSYVSIISNTISNNTLSNGGTGGGIAFFPNGIISNNWISNNSCNADGGGIYSQGTGQTIASNTITSNQGFDGGGIHVFQGDPLIINNVITNNSSAYGGGICVLLASGTPTLINNILANNYAQVGGGGLYIESCNPVVTNNTIVNNDTQKGGAMYASGCDPVFENCILYGNTANTSGQQVCLYGATSASGFSFCDIQDGLSAFDLNNSVFNGTYANNLDTLPGFVSPSFSSGNLPNIAASDWRLDTLSPCINNGNPADSYTAFDIVGNPRVIAGSIDMGAYEYTKDSVTTAPTNTNTNTGIRSQTREASQFLLSPNPFSFSTTLQLGHPSAGTLTIYSQSGVQLRKMTTASTESLVIPRGDLPSGLYFFQWLGSTGFCSSGKMIVE